MKGPPALLARLLDGVVTERPLLLGDDAASLADRLATLSGPVTLTGAPAGRGAAGEAARPGGRRGAADSPGSAAAACPAARALLFEQPFRDRAFDLVVVAGWTGPLPGPARTFVEMRRVSDRYVLAITAASPTSGFPDEERLAGLLSAAGLRVRKTRQDPTGLLGALAERPD